MNRLYIVVGYHSGPDYILHEAWLDDNNFAWGRLTVDNIHQYTANRLDDHPWRRKRHWAYSLLGLKKNHNERIGRLQQWNK